MSWTEVEGKVTAIIENAITADATFTYGWLSGAGGTSGRKGEPDDWLFAKGNNEGVLAEGVPLTTGTMRMEYLSYSSFSDSSPTWVGIPIATSGYRIFHVGLNGDMNVDFDISAYLLPEIEGDFNGGNLASAGGLLAQTLISAEVLSQGGIINFGIGGLDRNIYNAWPAGYLVIKMAPTAAPTSGVLRLGVERQK